MRVQIDPKICPQKTTRNGNSAFCSICCGKKNL